MVQNNNYHLLFSLQANKECDIDPICLKHKDQSLFSNGKILSFVENSTIQNAISKGILDSLDFYCNAIVLITRVLATQWVMLMLIRSIS